MDALEKYRDLIKELVPWIERGDWNGLLDHVERTWPIIDILFVWDSLRKKAFVSVLEREEAILEAILRRNLLSYYVVIGWWGAGAGGKRGTASPLSATPRQLEEAIKRNDNAKSGLDALVSYMCSIDAKLTRAAEGADAAEAARDAATANGATLAKIKGDTGFLAGEERRRKKAREKAAEKAAAARAEAEEGAEEKPYAQRITEALNQVAALVAKGKDDLAACRYVCKHYGEKLNQKTGAVIPGGLNKMDGDPMPPETLRDYYRRRRGTRKGK